MNIEEAKNILSAYPIEGDGGADPVFKEALEMAQENPELASWFEASLHFDRVMSEALHQVSPPPELRGRLLALNEAGPLPIKKLSIKKRSSLKKLYVGAILFAVILLIGVGVLTSPIHFSSVSVVQDHRPAHADFIGFAHRLVADDKITLGMVTHDIDRLRGWLADNKSPTHFNVGEKLKELGGLGCQTYDVGGSRISLICFMLDNNKEVHLFVIEKNGLRGEIPGPSFFQLDSDVAGYAWSDNDFAYYLTGSGTNKDFLKTLSFSKS